MRLLSSKPSASKSLPLIRPFTSVVSPTSHLIAPKTSLLSIQRRFASEITQSEPEADGATEAQHGDNSIATASQVSDVGPVTSEEESAASLFKEDDASASKDQSTPQEGRGAISEAAASVAGTAGAVGEMLGRPARSIGSLDSRGSRIEPEPSKTVYVGNLFFDVRAEDLEQHFESAGPIISAKIINDARGLSKGFVSSYFLVLLISISCVADMPLRLLALATLSSKTSTPPAAPSSYSIRRIMRADVSVYNFLRHVKGLLIQIRPILLA